MLLVVMLVLTIILFVYIDKKLGKPTPPSTPKSTAIQTKRTESIQIPFDYTVSRVSSYEVVLNGKNGELVLTKDITITVLKGIPGNSTPVDFSTLAAGQKIKLAAVPGKSATIYILP